MLEEAGGEFIALYVRFPGVNRSMTPLMYLFSDLAQSAPAHVAGDGARVRRENPDKRRSGRDRRGLSLGATSHGRGH
jgi:hypothetical protein